MVDYSQDKLWSALTRGNITSAEAGGSNSICTTISCRTKSRRSDFFSMPTYVVKHSSTTCTISNLHCSNLSSKMNDFQWHWFKTSKLCWNWLLRQLRRECVTITEEVWSYYVPSIRRWKYMMNGSDIGVSASLLHTRFLTQHLII
jgi:hypothetical protein